MDFCTAIQNQKPWVSVSLQCAPPLDIANSVRALENTAVDAFHFDIMDGHFVPNLALSFDQLRALRKLTERPIDVHLMMENPAPYLSQIAKAGANMVCFHVEIAQDIQELLQQTRVLGVKVGLAISPNTPLEALVPYVSQLDYLLVMGVIPGFAGQSFWESTLERLDALSKYALPLMVDGGLDFKSSQACLAHGASMLVAGAKVVFLPNEDVKTSMDQYRSFIEIVSRNLHKQPPKRKGNERRR